MTSRENIERWVAELDEDGMCDISDNQVAALIRGYKSMAVQLANAESKCRELAWVVAENADLKSLIEQHAGSIAVCPNCSHEEPSETDDIVALYRSMETPATDAFLAEVRAQGVDEFATELGNVYQQLRSGSNHAHAIKSAVFRAVEFAAQLRKGAAL